MDFYINSINLSFINNSEDLNIFNNSTNFSFMNISETLNVFNNSTNLSFDLNEFYQTTIEYAVVLDFIMGYGGIF